MAAFVGMCVVVHRRLMYEGRLDLQLSKTNAQIARMGVHPLFEVENIFAHIHNNAFGKKPGEVLL